VANERDIGAGIAALALVQAVIGTLRAKGVLSQPETEWIAQQALTSLEGLLPPDDVAVRCARELVENTLQVLVSSGQNSP
jgi:hypothetical protein